MYKQVKQNTIPKIIFLLKMLSVLYENSQICASIHSDGYQGKVLCRGHWEHRKGCLGRIWKCSEKFIFIFLIFRCFSEFHSSTVFLINFLDLN